MKNLDWNLARAFHATAREGSLSAAARKLGLTQPTLSRQIGALERMVGALLFERTGRRLMLTATGAHLLAHVAAMDEAANAVMLAAAGKAQALSGVVRLSVTEAYAVYIMPPIIARIRAEAPDLGIELVVTNQLSDLLHREADLAIRHQAPTQSWLIGEAIGQTEAHFYASSAWVQRHGMPADTLALAKAGLLGFDDAKQASHHLKTAGIPVEANDFPIVCNNAVALWEMARQGLGPVVMLREIAEGCADMVRLLPAAAPIVVPVWLVSHRELRTSRKIQFVQRLVKDGLVAALWQRD